MIDLMDTNLLAVIGVFLSAGVIKGISGMGLPTVSMAMLCLFMLPAKAAILMVGPSLLTNIAQCMGRHWCLLLKDHWVMWTTLFLFTVFSPYSGLNAANGYTRLLLGVILITYGMWGLLKPTLPNYKNNALFTGAVVGLLTGMVNAATALTIIPLVPYLQSLKLSKDEFIQVLGISFTVATIALAIRLGISNTLDWILNVTEIFLGIIAAFIGMWIGSKFRDQLNPIQFQRFLYSVFIVLGLIMAYKFI